MTVTILAVACAALAVATVLLWRRLRALERRLDADEDRQAEGEGLIESIHLDCLGRMARAELRAARLDRRLDHVQEHGPGGVAARWYERMAVN